MIRSTRSVWKIRKTRCNQSKNLCHSLIIIWSNMCSHSNNLTEEVTPTLISVSWCFKNLSAINVSIIDKRTISMDLVGDCSTFLVVFQIRSRRRMGSSREEGDWDSALPATVSHLSNPILASNASTPCLNQRGCLSLLDLKIRWVGPMLQPQFIYSNSRWTKWKKGRLTLKINQDNIYT